MTTTLTARPRLSTMGDPDIPGLNPPMAFLIHRSPYCCLSTVHGDHEPSSVRNDAFPDALGAMRRAAACSISSS
jgi:hypothetical protein